MRIIKVLRRKYQFRAILGSAGQEPLPELQREENNTQAPEQYVDANVVANIRARILFVGGGPDIEPQGCGRSS